MANQRSLATVQKWATAKPGDAPTEFAAMAQAFMLSIGTTFSEAPAYGSYNRPNWTSNFWRKPGNDLLAGAISTMVAKVIGADWYIEGPLAVATAYRDILLYNSNFGAGWDDMVQQWVTSYLDRDPGGLLELHRTSLADHSGPALGYAHLDESKTTRTGSPEWPVKYSDGDKVRKLHRTQVLHIVDMTDPRERMKGIGFCAVSRVIGTALIMMDIVRYKRERLSDLPPAGLLILNNLTDTQWDDVLKNYDVKQRNKGNETWRDIMVLCGIDPAYETKAELFSFSELPEHYDERTVTEMTVYTFACGMRMDPREIWPVSAGPLGTATEAEIQHIKAKVKGPGVIYTSIERKLNAPHSLPSGLRFGFDFQDDEDDLRRAQIVSQKLKNIRLMWETSPNRGEPEGIITTEEARKWAVRLNVIPPDIIGETLEREQIYNLRVYGPWVRAYKSGKVLVM